MKGLRFIAGLFVYGFMIALVLAGLTFWWGHAQFTKPGPVTQNTLFTVERGQGANQVAHLLFQEDIIDDPFMFMIGTTVLGDHTRIKAGEYEIQPGMSQREILALMVEGKTVARRITIREGLTSFEVVRLLNGYEKLSGEITEIPPEGALMPNTYDYQLNEPRAQVLARMQAPMTQALQELCALPQGLAFIDMLDRPCGTAPLKTARHVLTLASIIEKETSVPKERRKVAGVFINRLRKGMPLQTDPTVIYAITKGKHKDEGKGPLGRRLLRKDLQVDDPYNTYKYPGLPPGPIANPGKASIEAVLNPEEHEYLYFVADGTGGHAFGKTLREHNANVAKWRKIRAQR